MKTCKKCGAKNAGNYTYCDECGAYLDSTPMPFHIIRKSRNWHLNTITNQYIRSANLEATLAREKLAKEDKDAEIRRKRWDLDKD